MFLANSTSVENQFCRADNMGSQNGRGPIINAGAFRTWSALPHLVCTWSALGLMASGFMPDWTSGGRRFPDFVSGLRVHAGWAIPEGRNAGFRFNDSQLSFQRFA